MTEEPTVIKETRSATVAGSLVVILLICILCRMGLPATADVSMNDSLTAVERVLVVAALKTGVIRITDVRDRIVFKQASLHAPSMWAEDIPLILIPFAGKWMRNDIFDSSADSAE